MKVFEIKYRKPGNEKVFTAFFHPTAIVSQSPRFANLEIVSTEKKEMDFPEGKEFFDEGFWWDPFGELKRNLSIPEETDKDWLWHQKWNKAWEDGNTNELNRLSGIK